jgi:hypothetical protein
MRLSVGLIQQAQHRHTPSHAAPDRARDAERPNSRQQPHLYVFARHESVDKSPGQYGGLTPTQVAFARILASALLLSPEPTYSLAWDA